MNNIRISITPKNTKKYPLHRHNNWEIMYYLSGSGYLATNEKDIPFEKGSIIVVPPKIMHGSVSENEFVNISLEGDFNHLLMFESPVLLKDNNAAEGEQLAKLILNNRFSDNDYLSALCSAYIHYIMQNAQYKNKINRIVAQIITEINENLCNADFNISQLLKNSGYAEDYIRAEFKKITSFTPVRFLTNTRIDHARKLIEIYGNSITVSEVSQACGFSDYIYFSKRFKQFVGISPEMYKKQITETSE